MFSTVVDSQLGCPLSEQFKCAVKLLSIQANTLLSETEDFKIIS